MLPEDVAVEDDVIQRHRREMKDFVVKAASMKKGVPVSDKKRRKDILADIENLEKALRERHTLELQRFQTIANGLDHESAANGNNELQDVTKKMDQVDLGLNNASTAEGALSNDAENVDEDVEDDADLGSKKMSRAQRRRLNKQSKLVASRPPESKDDASKPVAMSARTTEKIKLRKILDENDYRLLDVPADGNCLFASLSHQLTLNGIQQSVTNLRSDTASMMRRYPDDFRPFLVHHETGDSFTDEDFAVYCHELEQTNAWGSQVELRALSRLFHWPIRVLQAEGPEVLIGAEYGTVDKIPLTVVYLRHELSLGEHYNSVVPK